MSNKKCSFYVIIANIKAKVLHMKRWQGSIDFEKYYGDKRYKKLQKEIVKKDYSSFEKNKMIMKIVKIIKEKNFDLYHNLMDYIAENELDCFNMLSFNIKERKFILHYIKSKIISKYRKRKK